VSAARCRLFAYGPADATAIPKPHYLASFKSRLFLSFWYWLTQVVLEKRPLNIVSSILTEADELMCDCENTRSMVVDRLNIATNDVKFAQKLNGER